MLCTQCEFENNCDIRKKHKKDTGKDLLGTDNRCSGILKKSIQEDKVEKKKNFREQALDDLLNMKTFPEEKEIKKAKKKECIPKKRPPEKARKNIRVQADVSYEDYEKLNAIAIKWKVKETLVMRALVKTLLKDESVIKEAMEWLV